MNRNLTSSNKLHNIYYRVRAQRTSVYGKWRHTFLK